MRLRVSSLSISSRLRNEFVEKFFELRDESFRKIADLSADARVRSGEARAGQQFEKIVKFFALGERVEKNRHRAEIERHRAEPEQMRGDRATFRSR